MGEINVVREDPLTLALTIPDGCGPGRWEAAVAFAEVFAEVKSRYPHRTFQYIPFSYESILWGGSRSGHALNVILAIAD